ncbi:RimJ/RimL family protein N-acetyltransferase [Pseudoduganella flava]|uniref:GNAT family N-acetyltransferase n=1 Tax=Pseudoduganella flava TaxID=871742 RepID=A0A562PW21_9BURK|nr:GNAT family protein [Pseudoduganella flava]QGZ39714.1 GNAT family N-acetyltransferase [Pseudoduganella flava]TWI48625.1 RimJ/RimL family protein N-acetyltransferase [Pseudoduganella flava]
MIAVQPVALEFNGVRLEPLGHEHADGLRAAACDGALWQLRVTSVPEPENVGAYITTALETPGRCAWAVRDAASGEIIGTTSYHDIVPALDRVEIGYTWYARSRQRSHVNTSCKRMLLAHAFDTLGCAVVGLRTDNFNHASQRAIERLGAKKDGVIRHHALRRDGTVRDTVMYSIVRGEWPEVRAHLDYLLRRHEPC